MKGLFLAIICLFSSTLFAQNTNFKKHKTLYFYEWGLSLPFDEIDFKIMQCKNTLNNKYGFDSVNKGGCRVPRFKRFLWEIHNNRIERKLKRRHGDNWRENYSKELSDCLSLN